MISTLSLQSLEDYVGAVIAESEPIEVTQERIDLFADATGDHQWVHVDRERARRSPFGGTIAHGFLTLSLLPSLFARCVAFDGGDLLVNYGLNRLRFPAPVVAGSQVRLLATLNEVREIDGGVEIKLGFEIGTSGAAKPAAVGESVLRAYREDRVL